MRVALFICVTCVIRLRRGDRECMRRMNGDLSVSLPKLTHIGNRQPKIAIFKMNSHVLHKLCTFSRKMAVVLSLSFIQFISLSFHFFCSPHHILFGSEYRAIAQLIPFFHTLPLSLVPFVLCIHLDYILISFRFLAATHNNSRHRGLSLTYSLSRLY